jgi:cell division septation protein DedD
VDQLLPHGPTPLPPIGHEAAPAPSPVPQAAVPTPAPHVASASDVRAEVHLSAPRPEPHAQAPKPAPKPSAKPETAAAGHLGGRYTLQLSSFTGEDEAAAFARKLRDDGLKPQVVASDIPGRGKFYRVRVGDYGSKQLADQARAEYDKKHRAPAIVTPM